MKIYDIVITDENEATGVYAVALVENPAIQMMAEKFSEPIKMHFDSDRMIMKGAAFLADHPIYRYSDQKGEYYVTASPATIEKMMVTISKRGFMNNLNLFHNSDYPVDSATIFESYQIDRARGINPPAGMESAKDGSWFISVKFSDPAVWEKIKNDDRIKGFSIEAVFKLQESENQEDTDDFEKEADYLLNRIKNVFNGK